MERVTLDNQTRITMRRRLVVCHSSAPSALIWMAMINQPALMGPRHTPVHRVVLRDNFNTDTATLSAEPTIIRASKRTQQAQHDEEHYSHYMFYPIHHRRVSFTGSPIIVGEPMIHAQAGIRVGGWRSGDRRARPASQLELASAPFSLPQLGPWASVVNPTTSDWCS